MSIYSGTPLLAQYDALAPDWNDAPKWAQWYTLFDNGRGLFWELEPQLSFIRGEWVWMEKDKTIGITTYINRDPLVLGIDWRLCKWHRMESEG